MSAATVRKFQIVVNQTGRAVGKPYKQLFRAHHRADKLDLEYGAVRYSVRPVHLPATDATVVQS